MWSKLLFFVAAIAAASSLRNKYVPLGPCKDTHESTYIFTSTQHMGEMDGTVFTAHLKVVCLSAGIYEDQRARRFKLDIISASLKSSSREMAEMSTEEDREQQELTKHSIYFVQKRDGTIPTVEHSREEDQGNVNTKKVIVSAFQGNLKGTKLKEEADAQSLHKAEYSYAASAQDKKNGVLRMRRKITNKDVETYAHHMSKEEVKLQKVEDLVFKKSLLMGASGTTDCTLMQESIGSQGGDIEDDNLESEYRRKRDTSDPQDPDDIKSFDPNLKTNRYESKGAYNLRLVGQRRLASRERRSIDPRDTVESSLLGFINQTRRDIEIMMELRYELGDIQEALETLHHHPNNSDIAHMMEELVKLEAQHGATPNESPAIDEVLKYLTQLSRSTESRDVKMRILLYFIISPEGSLRSQMALLESLQNTVNDEEREAVIFYLAMVSSPQPPFVAKLESLISSDVHSTDPLLLAYGAIALNASPGLQQRMVLFLTSRLPEAETNSTSLIHHILSLGNSGSPHASDYLIDYLEHQETDIQLMAIFAMRFLADQPSIEKSLKDFLFEPEMTEDHLTVMAKTLLYGCERAMMENQPKTYTHDLAESLVALSVNTDNEELHSTLRSYLKAIGTEESLELLQLMKAAKADETFGNTTRFRRGTTKWDKKNGVYNLVESWGKRKSDVKKYQNKQSYIWGKKFGGSDINAQVAAGAFAGVSNSGDYKLFGRAVAKAYCYNRQATIVDFLVLRQKDSSSTLSQIYTNVLGRTLINIYQKQDSSVCKNIAKELYEGKKYTLFDFTYSVPVVVGTLNFRLRATAQFTAGMYVEFCENHGSVTAASGLTPTLTIIVKASGDLEIAGSAKAGLTLKATFNYQVIPEVSTEVCYKQSQIRVKNCIEVYHQWADNTLDLYAWYAWRGWCGWWACTGKDAYRKKKKINALSTSWDLPGSGRKTIRKTCDRRHTC